MADVSVRVEEVVAEPYAAAPLLTAKLDLTETTGTRIHAIALRCQIRIEPQRRAYSPAEGAGLADQFGGRERWSQTLKPFLWLQCDTLVQGFTGSTTAELPMIVTYDFDVAASKYLHALGDGEVPLVFLFSGTIFTNGVSGFGVERVGWHLEDSFRMPVAVWHDCMRMHFPNSGWLRLDHDSLTDLAHYKAAHGLTTWDEVVARLLAASTQVAR